MQIKIISVGKTKEKYLQSGIQIYLDRLKHYGRIEYIEGKAPKGFTGAAQQRKAECDWIAKKTGKDDFVILLDENGRHHTSRSFAKQLNQWMSHLSQPICFVIGGAYGFDEAIRSRAQYTLSLSKMTFSHQMIRLIFT